MLQRLSIALAQIKAGNTSKKLQNKIHQITFFLYQQKEVTKKVHNNIINSIKVSYKIDTILMNSENSKTTNPYGLLLNLSEKTNLKMRDKYVALSNLSIYNTWKNIKKLYKNNKLQISVPAPNEKFELLHRSNFVSEIQDYFEYTIKKHGEKINNLPIRIYINKVENGIISKIKIGYYPEFVTPEMMKSLGIT